MYKNVVYFLFDFMFKAEAKYAFMMISINSIEKSAEAIKIKDVIFIVKNLYLNLNREKYCFKMLFHYFVPSVS